ncbi:DUF1829 domain-containing protein [Glaesserella parasuis]|uniref:DUF1829 domain-containing protein n=1 Tax=Glaesserella parasuis TaxID=738 RepID=UPI0008FC4FE9|nr:DUF1829 domain-containing protein [Glaesserella parasuis]OIT23919.1 hypothetical protein BLL93_09240 [Glaesserella parasuis]
MIDEIQSLMEQYLQWLKDKTALKQIDKDWVQVTTPHLDRHNDCLQFYIRKEANGFLLSDDGYIIHDLISSGCSLDSEKRKALLKMTLAGFGVQLDGETLILKASAENFALKKHNFLQAMLAVNDLFYLASPYVANLFYEDVVQWLDHSDIRYTPNIKFTGKSGFDHMFDFVIPKSRKQPERILQTLGNPKKNAIEATVFKWTDSRENRAVNSELFVLLNNSETEVAASAIDALKNYDIEPILWTERSQVVERLVA